MPGPANQVPAEKGVLFSPSCLWSSRSTRRQAPREGWPAARQSRRLRRRMGPAPSTTPRTRSDRNPSSVRQPCLRMPASGGSCGSAGTRPRTLSTRGGAGGRAVWWEAWDRDSTAGWRLREEGAPGNVLPINGMQPLNPGSWCDLAPSHRPEPRRWRERCECGILLPHCKVLRKVLALSCR
jgi:hypothetical protein